MKKLFALFAAVALTVFARPVLAQEGDEVAFQKIVDSLNTSFQWKTGAVALGENLATLNVPAGWRFLPAEQSNFVLTELWGNPPGNSLGMLFPENVGPLDSTVWAFDINFEELGYVKDDDAEDFDYNEILKKLQKEAEEANSKRVEAGYDPVTIIGWASAPYYDKEKKVLHWAKELQFGTDAALPHTLNYDVRVLGRKGVLSMNAIAGMERVEQVKGQVPAILGSVNFNEGNRYADFDSNVDEVAAWTIGGLVAGKVLAKAGFFALVLKFIKPILLLLGAGGMAVWRWFTGRKKEEETAFAEAPPTPETPSEPGNEPEKQG